MTTLTAKSLHPCARCARMQQTCCQRAEVYVTSGDVRRIAEHSGREDFHERRRPLDADYLEDDPDDPIWRRATVAADGTRRVLRRSSNGDCTFLGEAGCVLPEEVRPLVCRLYPFDYTESGFRGEAAEYCPRETLAPPQGSMAVLLEIAPSTAEVWRRELYAELAEELRRP